MAEIPEYVSRLLEILEAYDMHIQDREKGLEARRGISKNPGENLWVKGGAETLAAWKGAKSYILEKFPELRKFYKDPSSEI